VRAPWAVEFRGFDAKYHRLSGGSKTVGGGSRCGDLARVGVRRRWLVTVLRTLMASCRASASARISRHRRSRGRGPVPAPGRPTWRIVAPARRRCLRTLSGDTPRSVATSLRLIPRTFSSAAGSTSTRRSVRGQLGQTTRKRMCGCAGPLQAERVRSPERFTDTAAGVTEFNSLRAKPGLLWIQPRHPWRPEQQGYRVIDMSRA
jgi:hypothetical protein